MNKYYVGGLADFISKNPLMQPSKKVTKSLFENADMKTENEDPDEDELVVKKKMKKRKRKTSLNETELEEGDAMENKNFKKGKKKKKKIFELQDPYVKNQFKKGVKKHKSTGTENEEDNESSDEEMRNPLNIKNGDDRENSNKEDDTTDTEDEESNPLDIKNEVDDDDSEDEEQDNIKKKSVALDPEKESRSIFVGNVPCNTKIHKLKQLFSRCGLVDAVRFRCAATTDPKLTKKSAVIKQKFHPSRTNLVAYIRFKSLSSVEKSLEMNNHVFEGHTLQVDRVVNSQKHDQKKAVFVGNVPFSAEEDELRGVFADCGDIVGVRIVRDSKSGIGKGFAYVNFECSDAVELALKKDGHEMKNRPLRVSRAVKKEKKGRKSIGKQRKPLHLRDKRSNRKKEKEEKFSFQGETTLDSGKAKKKSFNKGDLKKSVIADILVGGHKHKPRKQKMLTTAKSK